MMFFMLSMVFFMLSMVFFMLSMMFFMLSMMFFMLSMMFFMLSMVFFMLSMVFFMLSMVFFTLLAVSRGRAVRRVGSRFVIPRWQRLSLVPGRVVVLHKIPRSPRSLRLRSAYSSKYIRIIRLFRKAVRGYDERSRAKPPGKTFNASPP